MPPRIFDLIPKHDQKAHDRTLTGLCIFLPSLCVVSHWSGIDPVEAVMFAGLMQAAMLPMIAAGALYHRFKSCDPRLAPPKWWDICLFISFIGLLIAGVWGAWGKIAGLIAKFSG